ncbi:MAG: ribonuclease Z [Oscillospiraceae bacterium]|nr:ribonuclease Z [Oscillospiraceae bacterium]
MILISCIDDRGGMLYNHRRQSQDRLLRQDLLSEVGDRPIWLSPYSLGQFACSPENLRPADDFPERAAAGEFCFFEDRDPAPWLDRAETIILYRWNRRYPADLYFPLPLTGWTLARQMEFPGSSHERITKEVYIR